MGGVVLPLALDGHVDRLTARAAGPETMAVAFYEDMPQALGLGGEALVEGARSVREGLEPVFVGETVADEALKSAVAFKRRVAWCYDSQIDEEVTAEIANFCRRYEGRERLWGNAAWRNL